MPPSKSPTTYNFFVNGNCSNFKSQISNKRTFVCTNSQRMREFEKGTLYQYFNASLISENSRPYTSSVYKPTRPTPSSYRPSATYTSTSYQSVTQVQQMDMTFRICFFKGDCTRFGVHYVDKITTLVKIEKIKILGFPKNTEIGT